ncbi:calpain-B-like isoform X3 [Neodiprion lecontei]|uniref:Calpain-B-like isoform X3 n=1 Tax=Neodiprion lecontei TaxID=441921 RepID=A0ABM3GAB4_NEOLC|nr:calpain-B-like isoform X3 [Neodiprion lecontei]
MSDSNNLESESDQPPAKKAKSPDDTLSSHQVYNKKKERQKRYREQNRDKLKQREAERRERIQYSQSIAGPSTSSNTNRIELHNEEIITAQSSSGLEKIQSSSIQRNDQGNELNALQKKRERQQRYRERNRDKLKQREAERRRCLQSADIKDGDGKVQDFYQIRRELCSKGKLFEDPQFPAVSASLFPKGIPKERFMFNYLKWVRPKEITAEPKFFVDGVSRFDIEQQGLGNCWLIAAISRLAMDPSLLFQVVPQDQNFNENYAGIFHFRFWRYGKWVEVVVDDRLPCYGTARSSERTEFWSALLVKAYAKFYGSWEATEDGQSTEAWQDFTGGLTSIYDLDVAQSIPFEVLLEAWEKKLLMGCGTPKIMKKLDGLYGDHAYCITEVRKYKGKNMVRLRNPWGMMEWQGQLGDADPLWKTDSKMAEALNFKPDADGEFWMPYELVSDYFTELEFCEPLDTSTRKLEVTTFEGEWQYNTTVSKGHLTGQS